MTYVCQKRKPKTKLENKLYLITNNIELYIIRNALKGDKMNSCHSTKTA